jgi:hypothetical protein
MGKPAMADECSARVSAGLLHQPAANMARTLLRAMKPPMIPPAMESAHSFGVQPRGCFTCDCSRQQVDFECRRRRLIAHDENQGEDSPFNQEATGRWNAWFVLRMRGSASLASCPARTGAALELKLPPLKQLETCDIWEAFLKKLWPLLLLLLLLLPAAAAAAAAAAACCCLLLLAAAAA